METAGGPARRYRVPSIDRAGLPTGRRPLPPVQDLELRTVTAPAGSQHTVRIEWIGNKLRRAPAQLRGRVRKLGKGTADKADVADGCFALDDLFAGLALLLALFLLIVVVLPLAWGLVELLLVVVLASTVWAFRVLFRRPWSVVHRGPGDVESQRWRVVGWRESHRVMVEAAESIERSGSAVVTPPTAGWVG